MIQTPATRLSFTTNSQNLPDDESFYSSDQKIEPLPHNKLETVAAIKHLTGGINKTNEGGEGGDKKANNRG